MAIHFFCSMPPTPPTSHPRHQVTNFGGLGDRSADEPEVKRKLLQVPGGVQGGECSVAIVGQQLEPEPKRRLLQVCAGLIGGVLRAGEQAGSWMQRSVPVFI